jgi:hypothetical protein
MSKSFKTSTIGVVKLSAIYANNMNLTIMEATDKAGNIIGGTTKKGEDTQLYQILLPSKKNFLGISTAMPSIDCGEHGVHQLNNFVQFWGPAGLDGVVFGCIPSKIDLTIDLVETTDAEDQPVTYVNYTFKDVGDEEGDGIVPAFPEAQQGSGLKIAKNETATAEN